MIYYSTSNSFPVRFIVKNVFQCFSEEERRYVPLQQSNKGYEGVSLLHNYLSLVIFILILKTRPFKKKRKKKEPGGRGCERDFSGFANKKSKLFLFNMRIGSNGLRTTRTYCLLHRCTGESSLYPKK